MSTNAATTDRVYANAGNPDVVRLIDADAMEILDVGCGAGDNAALLLQQDSRRSIYGITRSEPEAARARKYMRECWVADLEGPLPSDLLGRTFDCILFSHVLEHLQDPSQLVATLASVLRPSGACVFAVPNVLNWRDRLRFLQGKFEYQETGTLDSTHLRFFTYDTAAKYLLESAPELQVVEQRAAGAVPLWFLRKHLLSDRLRMKIDALGCELRPNLFGSQVLVKARRTR
jgi:2-polyprenyl-3-methyl-5-hydroxy-6-metoxy-1,4-benzoquinol methylase